MVDNHDDQHALPAAPAGRRFSWRIFGISMAILVVALLALLALSYQYLFRPVHLSRETELVTIEKRTSLSYAAKSLEKRGIIPNGVAFRAYAYLTNQANQLKVGQYEISSGMTPVQILALLTSGRARVFRLTIPEGKWASEIADLYLPEHWPEAAKAFPQLVNQPERWQETRPFLKGVHSLEGFLFPDTYYFPAGATAEQMTAKMLERFHTTCWAAYTANPPTDGRSFYEVLILASLVEGEAKHDDERAKIAGVYMNRLRDGWTLDCDATLIYARQQRITRVLNRDTVIESSYNTYQRAGLPPGPINNPGLESFRAALHPQTVDYYFYVARKDGSHVFSRTLSEHNANVQRFRGK